MKCINYKLRIVAAIQLLWLLILPPLLVEATALPASISVTNIKVNRHLLETGDMLFYAVYNIPYTVTPNETISQAFIFRLISTDNTTTLGQSTAYPYYSSGYGKGLISFYFSAAEVTALLTWGSAYSIRVSGNPALFPDPPIENFVISAGSYSLATSNVTNKAELADNIILIADTLETAWGGTITLLKAGETGIVFDTQGEIYFRNAIPGIQGMAPSLFATQLLNPDYTERTWSDNMSANYTGRMVGTPLAGSVGGLGSLLNLDFWQTGSLITLSLAILLMVLAIFAGCHIASALLVALSAILAGAVVGWIPLAMVAVMSFMSLLYTGYWWFARG